MVHLDTILICVGLFFCPQVCPAQFYSVERSKEPLTIRKENKLQSTEKDSISKIAEINMTPIETPMEVKISETAITSHGKNGGVKTLSRVNQRTDLPELTIPNLLAEIEEQNKVSQDSFGTGNP